MLIDADRIVRDLQEPGQPVFAAMVERWGPSIVSADGTLDRAAVAQRVFGDTDELEALNAIVHPAVGVEMAKRRAAAAAGNSGSVVVLDIPLLVRRDGEPIAERYRNLDGIVVVDTDPEVAAERLVQYRGFTRSDAQARIAQQASRETRLAVADFVIDNNGTLANLQPQINRCYRWARSLQPQP